MDQSRKRTVSEKLVWRVASKITDEILRSKADVRFSADFKYVAYKVCEEMGPDSSCLEESLQIYETSHLQQMVASIQLEAGFLVHDLSPNGKYIALYYCENANDDNCRLRMNIRETLSDRIIYTVTQFSDSISLVTFSADGNFFVFLDNNNVARVIETATGREVDSITANYNSSALSDIRFFSDRFGFIPLSPDGKRLITAVDMTLAEIWDIATGKTLVRLQYGAGSSFAYFSFSPSGSYINAIRGVSPDATVYVWDAATGKEIISVPAVRVSVPVFSPNDKYVALLEDGNNAIIVFDITTGNKILHKEVSSGTQQNPIWIKDLEFSPDNKYVAYLISDQFTSTVNILDFMKGNSVASLQKNTSAGDQISFSPDGQYLLSGDGTIWSVTSGTEVANMSSLAYGDARAFSSDSKIVVSRDESRKPPTYRIWEWQSQDVIANACAYLPRNLTRAEWAQFIDDAMPYQAVCENLPIDLEATTTPTITP